ncbi:uncharacterized protein LOC144422668 [Styela clava]
MCSSFTEIARLIQKSLDEKKKAEIKCDFKYDSKCYKAFVYVTQNVTFNDAQSICKSMNNGKPANIYDLAHYKWLLPHLRLLIPAEWIAIWTGMEYKNNQLLLSNGGPITIATEVWYPDYPISAVSRTNVPVLVDMDPEYASQGMVNYPPSSSFHGVICEI